MIIPDESYDQQIKSYKKSVTGDKRNDSFIFQYSITHIEVGICCDDKTTVINFKERDEEKTDAMVSSINYKRPYDDSDDEYFLADIPDSYDINYYEFTRNNNNHNHNKTNNNTGNNNGNSKHEIHGNKSSKKKKSTIVNMVWSLLQLKYRNNLFVKK